MRTVTFGVAVSLDNFIARTDHGVDWLMWGKEAGQIMRDYWKNIDTVVMGRKTYEIAQKSAGKDGGKSGGIKTYVFSRTLKPTAKKDFEIVSTDPGAFVQNLKAKKGKDICVMGGGELAKLLFEANVIDEIGLNIHPVLLGSGIP